jgi:hypothetical protein
MRSSYYFSRSWRWLAILPILAIGSPRASVAAEVRLDSASAPVCAQARLPLGKPRIAPGLDYFSPFLWVVPARQAVCPVTIVASCGQCAANCQAYNCGTPIDCSLAYSTNCDPNYCTYECYFDCLEPGFQCDVCHQNCHPPCDNWYYCACSGPNGGAGA